MGCAERTKVLLLDSGKSRNAILVSTQKGSKKVDKIGAFVNLSDKNQPPSPIKSMPKKEINSRYAQLFAIEPLAPRTYIVYFKANSLELTDESKKRLNQALKEINNRTKNAPCMVDIIGHTDTVGSESSNFKVSLKRAEHLKSVISKHIRSIIEPIKTIRKKYNILLTAKGYGEEDLLMKTSNNVPLARNRNVEIFIK